MMLTLCFTLEGAAPVLRYSAYRPQIGDTVSLPELESDRTPFEVVDVVGDGFDTPCVSIRIHQAQIARDEEHRQHAAGAGLTCGNAKAAG